ncbi:hypothetical protein LQF12_05175 [Ruania suaedae]|nr:hypothetical protein [Ruania suaedae]UFU04594.1 hypothetical protein LQF12_05175 [Ruania suaedae]
MRRTLARWRRRFRSRLQGDPERGDVPGWVLVTLMTAGLVVVIWALAGEALTQVFETAMDRVLSQ